MKPVQLFIHNIAVIVSVVILCEQALSSETEKRWQATIPVLTISDDGSAKVIPVRLRYERHPESHEPLTIAISEQLPMASGNSLRASIWQSAMVAALERNDPMTGVNIQLYVPGTYIDGPSAGCAFTVAILSAMDGRAYPTNVAVTGSVLPDGTVGQVGGVNKKIVAARHAGMTTIIAPDFLRLEDVAIGTNDVATVDLKWLAESGGLRYIPISNITDAYLHLHGMRVSKTTAEYQLDLPPELESLYYTRFEMYNRMTVDLLIQTAEKSTEGEDKERIDEIIDAVVVDIGQAGQAARMGYFDVAAHRAEHAYHSARSLLLTHELFKQDAAIELIQKQIDDVLPQMVDPLAQILQLLDGGLSLGGIQFVGAAASGRVLSDSLGQLGQQWNTVASWIVEASTNGSDQAEGVEQAQQDLFSIDYLRHFYVSLARSQHEHFSTNTLLTDMSVAYPAGYRLVDGNGAANLFYTACSASRQTLFATLGEVYDQNGLESLYEELISDPQTAQVVSSHIEEMRSALDSGKYTGKHANELNMAFVLMSVGAIAESARVYMGYLELEPSFDENGNLLKYERTGLLHALLRTARYRALESVQACREKGYPWLEAARLLRQADLLRDDIIQDKTQVLAGYWHASLLAKAMMMMLEADGPPVPSRSPLLVGAEVKEVLDNVQPTLSPLRIGDIITHIDGHRVKDVNELRALVVSMPTGQEYEVNYVDIAARKKATAKAVGGSMLGVIVVTKTLPPATNPVSNTP